MANLIRSFIDLFYPLFKNLMNKQMFYYIACGGSNTLFGFVLYYYSYHHLLEKQNFSFFFIVISPHVAAFLFSFIVTFPIGFLLSKYIVWSDSYLKGKQQLFRHFLLVILFFLLNYILLKLFVEVFFWWPFPSQVITTSIIIIISYLSQKYYSFKE
ncbi:MAG: GtrA family protein [Flavobacteriia bacterium]|nr:GtrA family protein [Flavobacteriia bacterium]